MKIFILCGGFGTRLDHESKFIAKPMVRIGKEPILYHLIENFYAQGFDEFVLCLGYRAETIVDYFIKEKSKHIRILQKNPLGTAHALSLVKNKVDKTSNIIILYGDMPLLKYSTLKLMINEYFKKNTPLLLYFKSKKNLDFGIVNLFNNKVTSIVENKYFSKADLLKNKYT